MKKLLVLAALCSAYVNILAEFVSCPKNNPNSVWKPACTASGWVWFGCQKNMWVPSDQERQDAEKYANRTECKNIYVR